MDEEEPHDTDLLSALVAQEQAANPEEFLLNQELKELLQKGIQELPLDQRVAIILCDVQGLSYEEIATSTQTSLGTVRSRIARGRKRLRDYLYQYQELLPRSYRLLTDRE